MDHILYHNCFKRYQQICIKMYCYSTCTIFLSPQLKHTYALVLVYDFLFGQGIQGGGEFKQCILKNKSVLQSCLARMKVRAKVHRNEDLLPKKAHEAGQNLNALRRLNTVLAVCEYMSFAKSWQEKGCSSQAETWQVENILMKDFD